MSKEKVELGIRKLRDMNDSPLMKWWWRYAMERDALWRRVICSKYNLDPKHRFPKIALTGEISKIFNDMIKMKHKNPYLFSFFVANTKPVAGKQDKISFWQDDWKGDGSLMSRFPRLYSLIITK